MASHVIFERVKETTTTTGTGAYTLAGASAGYQSFSAAGYANTNTFPYAVTDGSTWEVGIGTYNTGGTVSRTSIVASSTGSAINWGTGTKTIEVVPIAKFSGLVGQRHNMGASTDPTTTDDEAAFYNYGSLWFNRTKGSVWICYDPTASAAVWYRLPLTVSANTTVDISNVCLGGTANAASSSQTTVIGGNTNAASNSRATAIGGANNTASGADSVVIGGNASTASGDHSAVFGGAQQTVTGVRAATLGGAQNTLAGNDSVALGGASNETTTDAAAATVAGYYAKAEHASGDVLGGSYDFTTVGRNQAERLVCSLETTDATPAPLVIFGDPASYITIPANGCWYVEAHVVAATGSGATVSAWKLAAVVRRNGSGSPAVVGSVSGGTAFAQDAGASTWAATIGVDTVNNALNVNVTGQAATTIQWTGTLYITQVTD